MEKNNMLPIILISKSTEKIDEYLNNFSEKFRFFKYSIFKIVPENRGITIDQIREVKKLIATTTREKRMIVVYSLDESRQEAQNALLKILEEDSEKNQFILVVQNEENILATVRSRTKSIYLDKNKNDKESQAELFMENIIKNNNYRFLTDKKIDKISREDAVAFIDQIIIYLRKNLVKKDNSYAVIKKGFEYKKLLNNNNLNPQLTIDNFLIFIKNTLC